MFAFASFGPLWTISTGNQWEISEVQFQWSSVSAVSLNFLHDFILFMVDIHQIRLISLFRHFSDHFHFYPTLEPKCVIDLKSCHIEEIYESISECCAALLYSSPCLWPSPKTVPASFSTSPGKFRWLCLKWRQKAVIDSCGINISFRCLELPGITEDCQSSIWTVKMFLLLS